MPSLKLTKIIQGGILNCYLGSKQIIKMMTSSVLIKINKNARNISNVVLSTEKSKWENLGSFIESKMSINKSGASRPRRRSTFWQGIEWDTPIKFKTIDLYKALISSSSLMCEKRRQSYFILFDHMEEKIEGTKSMWIFLNLLFYG